MPQTLERPRSVPVEQGLPAIVGDMGLDQEASPFGLQGLQRETVQILRADCIDRLAVALTLRGRRKQIRDDQFVQETLRRHPEWIEEYRVVHLIEKSLWINGRSDLVMTLVKNPSQIPDNPPPAIRRTLSQAYAIHPEATIWYGVPLFGEEVTPDGLPIPLTAAEVRTEAQRRVAAAQTQALRWGWAYRMALRTLALPGLGWQVGRAVGQRIRGAWMRGVETYRQVRRDARRRTLAAIKAEWEHQRLGRCETQVPEHTTSTGQVAVRVLEGLFFTTELVSYVAPIAGTASLPILISKMIPLFIVPMTIVATDPFLFLELPDEPGKLRHLGHWYWQTQPNGKPKLHLHT